MLLGQDEITISLSPRVFVLRASLRAAFLLHQEYGSYAALSTAIADGSFTACADLIEATCTDRKGWIYYQNTRPDVVRQVLANREALLELVLTLAGGKRSGEEPSEPTKPITFEEYHAKLFRIATGWLGWTPSVAWNATPSEIINARQGRLEMLAGIFGKSEQSETIDTSDTQARAELNALGDLGVNRMSEAR